MRILCIDTTTKKCNLALIENDKIVFVNEVRDVKTHASILIPEIQKVLNENNLKIENIDMFSVVIGPGSFTGIRIGISAVKGLVFMKDKKVIPLSSLFVLQNSFEDLKEKENDINIPIIYARNDQIYAGISQKDFFIEFAGSFDEFTNFVLDKLQNREIVCINGKTEINLIGNEIEPLENVKNKLVDKLGKIDISVNIYSDITSSAKGLAKSTILKKSEAKDSKYILPSYLKKTSAERLKNDKNS